MNIKETQREREERDSKKQENSWKEKQDSKRRGTKTEGKWYHLSEVFEGSPFGSKVYVWVFNVSSKWSPFRTSGYCRVFRAINLLYFFDLVVSRIQGDRLFIWKPWAICSAASDFSYLLKCDKRYSIIYNQVSCQRGKFV